MQPRMQPSDEEQFEHYLKEFRPTAVGPLPELRKVFRWKPQAVFALAAVALLGIGVIFWAAKETRLAPRTNAVAHYPAAAHVVPATSLDAAGTLFPDLGLRDLAGKTVGLSDLRGKVLLVNFWATWCVPCRTEMPWFEQFQERYGTDSFQVVAISLDEDQSQCEPFIEQYGLEKLIVLLGNLSTAERLLGIVGLPTSFLLDENGRIISRHNGMIDRETIEREIVELLRPPPRELASLGHLNRFMQDPSQIDDQLTSLSARLLPDVERRGSTLSVLSKQ